MEEPIFGFLGFQIEIGGGVTIRGALLSTDPRGDPLEFQVAAPIRPNRVQRAIWGDGLIRHAVCKLLAEPLISRLESDPLVILTNRAEALELKSDYPLAHLQRGSDPGNFDSPHQVVEFGGATACLSVRAGAGGPRLIDVIDATDRMHELLNPLSVFDRVEAAMTALAESDERYR